MKKAIIIILALTLALALVTSCKKKVQQVPPTPPPEQPQVAKVEETPKAVTPTLSEEEIYASKTLNQINQEAPLGTIYFDFDKYNVREDARPVLDRNALWLKKFRTAKVLIEGHCDERGTEDYNLALGEKRAATSYDYLVALGVAPERIKVISYGKSQPIDPGHDETAWARNRRAQFLIIEK